MSNTDFENISFDLPKNQSNVIKVIGVGGGGSNAINHMFSQGIKGVDFVVCNTDSQALENSPVPIRIQLGVSLTEGLGAGANPEVGEKAAIESSEDIKQMLGTNTKMVFITAGMGGGTGTGAAPVIAKMSKEMDVLTVGIVTIPFQFEGKMRNEQAQLGVERLRSHVDSLIVINNNKLREVYGNLGFKAGFSKADEVLATASRGIAEVITHHYTQNIDLRDAKTVLSNSGTAIMGSANASGGSRAQDAIRKALDSPLLNDNKITGAKNVLLLIVSGTEEITIDEIGEINDHIQDEAGHSANIIMGVGEEESLGDAISVTIIATGFNVEQQNEIVNTETKKIIHTLEDEQRAQHDLSPKSTGGKLNFDTAPKKEESEPEVKPIVHTLDDSDDPMDLMVNKPKPEAKKPQAEVKKNQMNLIPTTDLIRNLQVVYEEVLDYTSYEEVEDTYVDEDDFKIVSVEDPADEPQINLFDQEEEEQFTLSFDLPLNDSTPEKSEKKEFQHKKPIEKSEEEEVVYSLDDDINEIEVNNPVEIVSITEVNEKGEKRYSLDDYMEMEDHLNTAKPAQKAQPQPKVKEEEIAFEHKVVEPVKKEETGVSEEDENPMNTPISQLLTERAAERRRMMKEFNYKFHNNQSRIDEIEKQPAYKRMGVNLDENPNAKGNISRTSLSTDENDEIQLRRNNSFLHDNVD
ncbi:cell division protein FtsZ [Leeuwenhoekiella aestuarii]|uniref:Cell division protein FtsZ n=1 Tax=Leeuwenhoekiella aestuarii TaxID=2249426 RepID=A0A4Q0NSF6_9FLAO|nr:cell division protein FtsZ [Leeuwenhoekiella aestuarii]RXG13989.1 cell division protein FtsZ [Leeuwenhoekiella aestuarii]RXG18738.1 cell division protein FtsZ [Leeuwenhoekiella aestuarii]